jgi:hypothetical protein
LKKNQHLEKELLNCLGLFERPPGDGICSSFLYDTSLENLWPLAVVLLLPSFGFAFMLPVRRIREAARAERERL